MKRKSKAKTEAIQKRDKILKELEGLKSDLTFYDHPTEYKEAQRVKEEIYELELDLRELEYFLE